MVKKFKRPLAFLMSLFMIMAFSFSDGLLGLSSLVYADDGSATAVPDGDGSETNPYLIEDYADLVWFQQKVDASSDKSLCAKLVNDIIANEDLLDESGEVKGNPDKIWTPICQNSANGYTYTGTFDGNGYSISGLYCPDDAGNAEYVGLFGVMGSYYTQLGTIQNLTIEDSYFKGTRFVGSFVGYAYKINKIENCGSTATVCITENEANYSLCGGITAYATPIKNCYFAGKIIKPENMDEDVDAIANDGSQESCYYLADCGATSTKAISKEQSAFKSGEVCFLLNNKVTDGSQAWYQLIDTDSYPILDKGDTVDKSLATVYKGIYNGSAEVGYSNSSYSCGDNHIYNEKGFCEICDSPEVPTTDTKEVYQIGNYGNLVWFQQYVDAGNYATNAILTADIKANENLLSVNSNGDLLISGAATYIWTPIRQNASKDDYAYSGTFDGNGYSISGLYYNDPSCDYVGLFGRSKGTIKNLIISDSYFYGKDHVGSFVGAGHLSSKIENCASYSFVKGYQYSGGIAGTIRLQQTSIKNCFFAGENWTTDSAGYGYPCKNPNISATSSSTIENCYVLGASDATASDFASGKICYLLNNAVTDGSQAWYQTIGTDSYPILDKGGKTVDKTSATVYIYYNEAKAEKDYSNTQHTCSHSYENGICPKCDELQEPTTDTNGVYQIENYGNLVWFQQKVDSGSFSINANLTADITANEDLLDEEGNIKTTPQYNWTPICQSTSGYYTGTFNGNGHFISGLYCTPDDSTDYLALFGKAKGTIKNLIIKDSYFKGTSSSNYVATFVGYHNSGTKIENCGSSAIIEGKAYCGGIAGGSQRVINITNCYFIGKMKNSSTTSSADLSAISDNSTYPDNVTLTNCYYLDTCGATSDNGATKKTADELADICEGVEFHSYENGKCSLCGDTNKNAIIPIYNFDTEKIYNNLGLVFCMRLSSETADADGSYVKFTLPDGTEETYQIKDAHKITLSLKDDNFTFNSDWGTASISDDIKSELSKYGIGTATLYIFPCNIAPWELSKTVKAEIVTTQGSETFNFSVKDNLKKEVVANIRIDEDALSSVLLNYGGSVQEYFDYLTDNLANKGIEDTPLDSDFISEFKSDSSKHKVTNDSIGSFTGLDLVLGSTMTLNAYFQPKEGVTIGEDWSFTINGEPTTLKQSGNKYILSAENIGIQNSTSTYTFKVTNPENEELELSDCSIYNYMAGALNSEDESLNELISYLAYYCLNHLYLSGD